MEHGSSFGYSRNLVGDFPLLGWVEGSPMISPHRKPHSFRWLWICDGARSSGGMNFGASRSTAAH